MRIKRLYIQKMPGFPHGLKAYENLADNINIIAGANGTGKSSTARVIQKLIWWKKNINLNVAADLEIDNQLHTVQIDSPFYYHTDPQGKRDSEDFRAFVSENFDKQYILALHDLVKGDDEELAKDIIKEVNGGFDLDSATTNLGYNDIVYNTKRNEYKEYIEARDTFLHVRNDQETLREKLQQIEKLNAEVKKAKEALHAKEFYTNLIDWLEIKKKHEDYRAQLAGFSPVLEDLRTDDWEHVDTLEKKIEEGNKEIILFEQKKADAAVELNRITVPQTGKEGIILEEVESYRNELREKKRSLETLWLEIVQWVESRKDAASSIGLNNDIPTDAFHLEEIKDIDSFVREANRVEGEYKNRTDRKEELIIEIKEKETENQNKPQDAEVINSAISELSKWLKTENRQTASGEKRIGILAIISCLTALAIFFWGWPGFGGILLILAILIYDRLRIKKEKDTALSLSIAYYNQLGLEPLPEWSSEQVSARLEFLIAQLRSIKNLNDLKKQLKDLTLKLDRTEEKRQIIREKYNELTEKLSLLPGSLRWEKEGYDVFYYFIQKLLEWQKAGTELRKKERAFEEIQKEYNAILKAGNNLFILLGEQQVDTIETFEAQAAYIRKQVDRQKELLLNVNKYQGLIEQYQKQREENLQSLQVIYGRLKLQEKEDIRLLSGQLDDYRKTKKIFEETRVILQDRQETLRQSTLYNEELELLTIEEAVIYKKQFAGEAERYDQLIEEIKSIEVKVDLAESGNTLEKAIDRQDKAIKSLEETFDANLQSLTGSLIVNQLRKEISLNNENKVFREANKILGDITQERYGLTLSDVKDSTFKAIDHVTGHILTLEELSTGTRVQLLLAIRLAYIKSLEKNIKLPILADELLANSDDQRSEAIIRSLIEISKERQVFYFTAQMDEVIKWKAFLEKEPEIFSEIISLDEKSRLNEYHIPEIQPVLWIKEVPEPGTLSHDEYGHLLQIQPFNLLEQNETELHLWYLFEPPARIYSFLQRGIRTWGQLKQLREKGNEENLTTAEWKLIDQKIGLLQSYIELYRIGRPLKIDRAVIETSKIISETFIDRVSALLEECGGNPLALLEALPGVPRLQKSKIDDLREYLIENKYIDGKDLLGTEDIHIALQSRISSLGISPETADQFIGQLISV